jgi:hypothetical protein
MHPVRRASKAKCNDYCPFSRCLHKGEEAEYGVDHKKKNLSILTCCTRRARPLTVFFVLSQRVDHWRKSKKVIQRFQTRWQRRFKTTPSHKMKRVRLQVTFSRGSSGKRWHDVAAKQAKRPRTAGAHLFPPVEDEQPPAPRRDDIRLASTPASASTDAEANAATGIRQTRLARP